MAGPRGVYQGAPRGSSPWGPLVKPSGPSHGSRVGKPKLVFSPKMSGIMSSHRISMVYGGFAGFWGSLGPHTLILGSFWPIFQFAKGQKWPFLDFWQPSPPQKHIFSIPPFLWFSTPMVPNKTTHDRVRNNNTIASHGPWTRLAYGLAHCIIAKIWRSDLIF